MKRENIQLNLSQERAPVRVSGPATGLNLRKQKAPSRLLETPERSQEMIRPKSRISMERLKELKESRKERKETLFSNGMSSLKSTVCSYINDQPHARTKSKLMKSNEEYSS
mmetsp:Transcript_996/g.998  ORF Transcript_996/g.998 Transcript_996/m.998 type:complete len:111 (+) Transcript_996:184-516(+)